MTNKQLLSISGSAVLFIAVFLPVLSGPLGGQLNFLQNTRGIGYGVLVLSVASLFLSLRRRFDWLVRTGSFSLGLVLAALVSMAITVSGAKAAMEKELANNPFRVLAELAGGLLQLQWGWPVLILGAGLIIAGGLLEEERLMSDAKDGVR